MASAHWLSRWFSLSENISGSLAWEVCADVASLHCEELKLLQQGGGKQPLRGWLGLREKAGNPQGLSFLLGLASPGFSKSPLCPQQTTLSRTTSPSASFMWLPNPCTFLGRRSTAAPQRTYASLAGEPKHVARLFYATPRGSFQS